MHIKTNNIVDWFVKANEKIQVNQEHLTALDKVLGDGDHGLNMAGGFHEVEKMLTETAIYETVSDILKDVAMIVMTKVGGAAGPLFGTAFLKMSLSLKDQEAVNKEAFTKALEAGLEGIKYRGKADVGEKTMVDVWAAVVKQLKESDGFFPEEIVKVAHAAMVATKEVMATKGRAAFLKEKSLGHIDSGAASSYYLFEALAEVLAEVE